MKKTLPLIAGMLLSSISFTANAENSKLSGAVKLDGSSTVFPISEAVAEEFQRTHPKVRVTVGLSGTGGGFKKFTSGEIEISNASRKIKESEVKNAEKHKVKYIALPIAFDGLSVMVNPNNHFVDSLTLEELKKIWEPGSKVSTWKDINPKWPAEKIKLYGPGADSGTFDLFTEEVVGKARKSRADYVSSEDDNVIVRGISSDPNALGYFGYAYYVENENKLKLVGLSHEGKAPIKPSPETIENGSYVLARPLLIYVSLSAAQRPEVESFVEFYLKNAGNLAKEVGYVPLPEKRYEQALADFQKAVKEFKQAH